MKVKINTAEAIRYMGYGDTPSDNEMRMIERCRDELERTIKPAWIYRAFDIEKDGRGVLVKGTSLVLKGNDIMQHLDGCDRCILLCATASVAADELIRRYESEDIVLGFMTDCLASAAVESVCNALEQEIAEKIKDKGIYMTWRFSPGYGDFPLEIQPDFVTVLDAPKRAGVTCTESLLLAPRKSVTAVIGLSNKPIERKRQGCAVCKMADRCQFRKRGSHCGS